MSEGAAPRELGIDVARGLAVLGVVFIHSIVARDVWVPEAVRVSAGLGIFVLFALMGVVLGIRLIGDYPRVSLACHSYSEQTRRRLGRFLPGFAVTWVVTLILGMVAGTLVFGPATLIGMLPVPGPGNYFIPVLFTWVLITPFVAWGSQRSLSLTVALLVFADVAWWPLVDGRLPQLWAWSFVGAWGMLIGAGLWVGARGLRRVDGVVASAAAAVIVAYLLTPLSQWVSSHVGMTLYSAAFVLLAVWASRRFSASPVTAAVARLGRATWTVFLLNMVWFGALSYWLQGTGYLWVLADVSVCVAGGMALAWTGERLRAGIQR